VGSVGAGGEWVAPQVECVELVEGRDGTVERKPLDPPVESPASGDDFFRVEPGRTYEVHLLSEGEIVDPRTIVVPATPSETLVDLRLPDKGPSIVDLPSEEEETASGAQAQTSGVAAAGRAARAVSLHLLLEWKEGFPVPDSPPPIEALLERIVEGHAAAPVAVEWSFSSPVGGLVLLPCRRVETQPLPRQVPPAATDAGRPFLRRGGRPRQRGGGKSLLPPRRRSDASESGHFHTIG
jgi:hypothetical protein